MDDITLEFAEGFTVVTGETGAGKSILLGALSLLSGNRVGKTIIRKDTETCEVEGVLQFADSANVDAVLGELGLPACESGQLILRRNVSVSKPGRVFINGTASTLAQLEALSQAWIDFHGPNEPQKLFHEKHQLALLDLFAGAAHQARLLDYAARYAAWREALREVDAINSREKMSEEEIGFVQTQLDRMKALDLSDEGVATLESDFKRVSSAQELGELFAQISNALDGDNGLLGQLPPVLRAAREIAALDTRTVDLEKRLNALAIEIADIHADYARLGGDSLNDSPDALEEITARMNQWLELRRKYGPSPKDVRTKRDTLANKLAMQGDIAGVLEKARAEAARIEGELRDMAAALRKTRSAVAAKLAAEATRMLEKLGFKKADLDVRVVPADKLDERGDCACRFLFRPNAGQDLLPLNQIASSGETARVMLALKTVLASVDRTPVLVFDEVDANVGGEIGAHVGHELAALANGHQVFCVTHLPQVAAQGRQHFQVTKSQTADSTSVTIVPIHDDVPARESELARMLGNRHSASALTHARELLTHP